MNKKEIKELNVLTDKIYDNLLNFQRSLEARLAKEAEKKKYNPYDLSDPNHPAQRMWRKLRGG